ncbi:hypothetical protein LSH36_172g02007 [Paralvinella palmiformis]|uniref:Uncharacterized protein n=1 Tax=Paralvinella palmiformis TaxID=53620 RepID=A0AAD9N7J4_9ANNE|nr:hypothetical protein LSH36_172g02007 [Paralvinella palmiformis]
MAGLKISAFLGIVSLMVAEAAYKPGNCVFHVKNGEMARGNKDKVFRVLTVEECHQIAANTRHINFANFILSGRNYRNICMLLKHRPTKFVSKSKAQYFEGSDDFR